MATLRIYKAPSGQWAGQLVEDGIEMAGLAGFDTPEEVEMAAQESDFDYARADYEIFHLVSVRKDDGQQTMMTKTPVTHDQGMTMIGKLTEHDFRELKLIEI